jgi:hypothetical protein
MEILKLLFLPYLSSAKFHPMAKFILLIREDLSAYPRPEDELNALIKAHSQWARDLMERGIFIDGNGIGPDGRLIEMINGDLIVQPLRDVRQGIGGYYIVEAPDLYEAVEIAKGCPTYKDGDLVEVRPIM